LKLEDVDWELLSVFENEVRVEIVKLLLEIEFRSLSEIAERLEKHGWKMTLSGVMKHMKQLEKAGVIRHESGVFAKRPDARKTIYLLEGRERVERLLRMLENEILKPLQAGAIFAKTAKLAREVQRIGRELSKENSNLLESLLIQCESEDVYVYLTEDEKKKLKLWRMMMSIL